MVPIYRAWEILEKDGIAIVKAIMKLPTLDERVKAIEIACHRARHLAKKMMAKYHPDVNPDPAAISKFRAVQDAMDSIKFHTIDFKAKAVQLQQEKAGAKTGPIILVE